MKIKLVGLMLIFLGSLAMARAQSLTLTVTGTASSNAANLGFTQGQVGTFTFTINPNYGSDGSFEQLDPGDEEDTQNLNRWAEETLSQPQLFTSVSGSLLGGNAVRPSADEEDPFSVISISDPHKLNFRFTADRSDSPWFSNIGLTAGGHALYSLEASNLTTSDFNFTFTGTGSSPTDYLTTVVGLHALTGGVMYLQAREGGSTLTTTFTATSINIAFTAVPEPATYAAIAGAVALVGVGIWRRRRR